MSRAWVKDSVVNLRREPVPHNGTYWQDPLQESQILRGEEVLVHETRGDWARVGAVDQPRFRSSWQPYPGWVPHASLHDAPPCPPKKSEINVSDLVPYARQFLGSPYLWGGRSPYPIPGQLSGVDCSGLVHLAYGACGVVLPRDAHDQWLVCQSMDSGKDLEEGDLLFFEPKHGKGRMDHVMLFCGGNQILEATMDVGSVREVSGLVRFGYPVRQLQQGQECGNYRVFLGRCKCLANSKEAPYQADKSAPAKF